MEMTHPKVVLLSTGEDCMLNLAEWQKRKDIWTGIGSFAIAFEGDVLKTSEVTLNDLFKYDIIIANLDRSSIDRLLSLQDALSFADVGIKWVSLIERCATDYLVADPRIKRLLDNSDLVNVINKHSLGFFRALTSAPCEYIGIPYPSEGIRKRFYTEARENRVMLPAYVDPPAIVHNASYLAAKGFGFELYGAQKDNFNYGDPLYKPSGKMVEPLLYFPIVASSFAFMNLDHRYTWGRNVLECASLGVPCIATRSTGHAEDFFPQLMVTDEFSIEEARELLRRLKTDKKFYEECANPSLEKMNDYTHEHIKEKILTALYGSMDGKPSRG